MGSRAIWTAISACGLLAFGCSSAADDGNGNTAGMTGGLPPGQTMMPVGMGIAGMVAPGQPMGGTPIPGMTGVPMAGSGDVMGPPMTAGGTGATPMMPDPGTAGSAGSMMTGEAGSMGEAGSGEPDPAARKPPCLQKGSQLALVGDSYIEYVNSLTPLLEQRATAAGALPAGQHYNNQAVPGSSLAVGLLLIAPQWEAAKRASMNDIKFVVMDGGGNDVLLYNMQCLADGSATDPQCQKVADDASAVAKEIMEDMKATGVSDVLYFFYPHVPAGGQDILDNYAGPKAKKQCEDGSDATFRCHFVSLVEAFEGHANYIDADGIHPSAAGAQVQADVIWGEMQKHCMGQAPGSECCM